MQGEGGGAGRGRQTRMRGREKRPNQGRRAYRHTRDSGKTRIDVTRIGTKALPGAHNGHVHSARRHLRPRPRARCRRLSVT